MVSEGERESGEEKGKGEWERKKQNERKSSAKICIIKWCVAH